MIPPEWALKSSIRLSLDEFQSQFVSAWSQIGSRFLKLECWRRYREIEASESQDAYICGDVAKARELLRQEAEADRPLYDGIGQRGIDYARVRLVQEPLTPYLEYELMAYQIRAQMGEHIEVVRCGQALRIPNEEFFDFLLFDRHTMLLHDYGHGEAGWQSGGWVTHNGDVIAFLESKAMMLRQSAVTLQDFLTEIGR